MIISINKMTHLSKRKMLIVLIFSLFLFLFYRGLDLHLRKSITDRIRFHAIPVAMSVLYHHHPHDYTGLHAIAMPFQGPGGTDELMHKAKRQDIGQDKGSYYWVADDKGFEDYVIAAFYLFGPHLYSLYNMWFIILFSSIALFLLTFNRQIYALGFLCLTLLGVHLAISTLPLSAVHLVKGIYIAQVSIFETRFLDVLALIPVIHILLLSTRRSPFRLLKDGVPLLGQMFIFISLYHCRSSLGWEVVSIFMFCFASLALIYYRNHIKKQLLHVSRNYRNELRAPIFVIVFLAVSLIIFNLYKFQSYNHKYYAEMGQRTFWHNALMGLAQEDSFLAKKYVLANDDALIASSVIRYARNEHLCTPDIEKLEAQELLNTLGGYGVANWKNYEKCAKSFYFSIIQDNKLRVASLYGIRKPLASLNLLWVWSHNSGISEVDVARDKSNIGWSPLSGVNLSIFLAIMIFSYKSLFRARRKILLCSAVIFSCSFIPSVAFYNAVLTMGGFLVFSSVLLYLGLMISFNMLYRSFFKVNNKRNVNYLTDKKISIVIPAFNEENRISGTISEVYSVAQKTLEDFEIIVVDDGSKDSTSSIALDLASKLGIKVKVIVNKINQGVGSAFHLGLERALFPYLCLIPGDNAFKIDGIELLFSSCGSAPLVVTYRQNMEARTPLRHVLSKVATFSLRLITGFRIRDAHSLYLFPVAETRALNVNTRGYGYHMETLSRLLKRFNFIEVPVTLNPKPDASSGVMKLSTLIILGLTIIKLFFKRVLNKL